MLEKLRHRLTYANVTATAAMFAALGGGAYAAATIGPGDIKRNAVRSKHIQDDAVQFRDLKGVKSWHRRVAPSGGSLAAADPVALAKRGTVRIYGKCYLVGGTLFAATLARTSADGAAMETASGNDLDGNPDYLDSDTPEAQRGLAGTAGALDNSTNVSNDPEGGSFAIITAAHKLGLSGIAFAAVKHGTPPAGNGPYGAGDRCSFNGFVIG